ncbi:phosphate acyltransferase [Desulfomicrobium baculatum]|uniref:Phosphate acetyl/butaryl transferase n=1 Tax=Desulfomicrobium baculatum (strain DSM 4028 / VKM B-1378 / X) TaxID=525897 RepID=C7LT11_DESBD|nr:phosphate acyltransferase [Desulfomicrobium baculatum]ACU90761.1 phosphate acetyl/butaryl transferase [Desulfomicrobium baculatum DSM 4028]
MAGPVRSLERMVELVRSRKTPVRVVIAACAEANAVLAGLEAARQGLAEPVFVGDVERMRGLPELASENVDAFECLHEPDDKKALAASLDLLQDGRAQFLMKGGVKTDVLLRAVLGRKRGSDGLLSHIGVFPHPREERLLIVTDAGVNIAPSLTRKIDIINNAVAVAKKLGMDPPKVAVLSATEKVSYNDMVSSKDADILAKLCRMGIFGDAVVGGPFALDIAVSTDKARAKGVDHPAAGRADILCAPNIVTGNVLYKAVTSLMDLPMAGIVVGASYPLVVPSRGDSDRSKFYALALAAYLAGTAM